MTKFRNTKATVTNIGCLTKINPEHIYCAHCQEQFNEALDVVVLEINESDPDYFTNFGTTVDTVNFDVQLKPGTLSIMLLNSTIQSKALTVYTM
eukprot:7956429-Ditylum_brightwellii.AAC.1